MGDERNSCSGCGTAQAVQLDEDAALSAVCGVVEEKEDWGVFITGASSSTLSTNQWVSFPRFRDCRVKSLEREIDFRRFQQRFR